MLTDIPRAYARVQRRLHRSWGKDRRRSLVMTTHFSPDGRPILTIGLHAASLIRWVGLQVLYRTADLGWSKRTDILTRADADDEVRHMIAFLHLRDTAPLDRTTEDLAGDLPPAVYGIIAGTDRDSS